jgi:hypothetical protein
MHGRGLRPQNNMEFVMTNRTQRLKRLFANPREISLERALLYTASHKRPRGAGDDPPGEGHRLDPRPCTDFDS